MFFLSNDNITDNIGQGNKTYNRGKGQKIDFFINREYLFFKIFNIFLQNYRVKISGICPISFSNLFSANIHGSPIIWKTKRKLCQNENFR